MLEGQSSLRNPAGPCGAEFLLSGNARGVILQHVPFRTYFEDLEELECCLPKIEDDREDHNHDPGPDCVDGNVARLPALEGSKRAALRQEPHV